MVHPDNSIDLDTGGSHDGINSIFNKSKYFYCYDPKTMFTAYAMICGCIPIIYPLKNMSRDEYSKKFFLGLTKGFAYGEEDKEYAEQTLEEGTIELLQKLDEDTSTIYSFLDDLEKKFNL